ncbi:hypothetical protein ACSQ67_023796 [Phaseolus vulgaris]
MDHASSSSFLIIYFILFVILYSLLFIHFSSFIQRRSSLSRVANGSDCDGNSSSHHRLALSWPAVFLEDLPHSPSLPILPSPLSLNKAGHEWEANIHGIFN